MPAAVPYIQGFFTFLASEQAAAYFVRTILINVALGALEFHDEHGEAWVAIDEG